MKLPKLYSKTSKGVINVWEIQTLGNVVQTTWGPLDGVLQTSTYQAEGKNAGRSNETSPEEQAILEAQSRWEKQKRLKYFESVEDATGTLNLKPMRAYSLDEKRAKKMTWPVDVQAKYNGVRCMATRNADGSVRLISRGGKDYTAPHIQEELRNLIPRGYMLDGELYIHNKSLQTIRHLQAEKSKELRFYVYDMTAIPANNTPWADRKARLLLWFSHLTLKYVTQAPTWSANNMNGIERLHDKLVAKGYEGIMLRTLTGAYKLAGKSTDLLKYKKFQDAEFRVVRWSQGKDDVPVFTCIQEEGREFDVRPVGTAEERAEMLKEAASFVGRMLTVKFQERSDDNIPIFPVGLSFRPEEDMD